MDIFGYRITKIPVEPVTAPEPHIPKAGNSDWLRASEVYQLLRNKFISDKDAKALVDWLFDEAGPRGIYHAKVLYSNWQYMAYCAAIHLRDRYEKLQAKEVAEQVKNVLSDGNPCKLS